MRRIVLPLIGGLLTVLIAAAPVAARPGDWVHVCVFRHPEAGLLVTNYGHVSGPGMDSAEARYWTEWCEQEVNGQIRGVKPFPKRF